MKKSLLLLSTLLIALVSLNAQKDDDYYSLDKIQEIKIDFEQDNWRYLLDSLRYNGDGKLIANVEVNGANYSDVGIRYWLGTSFQPGALRNDLHIDLDMVRMTQQHAGRSAIELSSAVRDPSMVREVLAYNMARQYMPAPRANFAKLYINDEYWGLYVNVEPVDRGFLQDYFGSSSRSFYYSKPKQNKDKPTGCKEKVWGTLQEDSFIGCLPSNFEDINKQGYEELADLIELLNRNPEQIERSLDVDRTLWMLAFNNVLANLDSYTGQFSPNYYLYQKDDGQFVPILWDLNLAFGSLKNTGEGSDLSVKAMQKLDPLLHADNRRKPLISQLLKIEGFKKMYLSHVRTILYDHFLSSGFEKHAQELQQKIKQAFIDDPNKYYDLEDFEKSLNTVVGRTSKIPGLVSFMDSRADFLEKEPNLLFLPSQLDDIQFKRRERFSNDFVKDFQIKAKVTNYPKMVYVFYRFSDTESYKRMRAYDDGKHNDEKAGDGIFGLTIKPVSDSATLQYYFMVENAKTINFDPSRYMYEPHKITLAELNR
jgi:hypothetical protein